MGEFIIKVSITDTSSKTVNAKIRVNGKSGANDYMFKVNYDDGTVSYDNTRSEGVLCDLQGYGAQTLDINVHIIDNSVDSVGGDTAFFSALTGSSYEGGSDTVTGASHYRGASSGALTTVNEISLNFPNTHQELYITVYELD